MTNVFRPVDGETILPARIAHGKGWRNHLFSKNTSVAEYQKCGLYLEVGEKPTPGLYEVVKLQSESIDHTRKEVNLTWELSPMVGDQLKGVYAREYEEVLVKGFEYNGEYYRCTKEDLIDWGHLFELVQQYPDDILVPIRTTDNKMIPITVLDYVTKFKPALGQFAMDRRVEYWARIDEVK